MTCCTSLRTSLSVLITTGIVGALVAYLYFQGPAANTAYEKPSDGKENAASRDWPLFGGTNARNLVNLIDKNIPTTWDVKDGSEKNIKWSIPLGSKAYGGPVIYRGKLFIGTNNDVPRDAAIKGDKGVMMCFEEATGKLLWQAVHDKLRAGQVNDWPHEGICSSPVVENNRLYYVNNRSEVVCADVEGDGSGKAKIYWSLDMIKDLNNFPHNLSTCSPLIVNDTLFLITSNGVDERHIDIPSPDAPSFLAIDKKTGKVKWSDNSPSRKLVEARKTGGKNISIKELVDKGLVLMHGQWSNPVYAEPNGKPQIIFPGGDGWMYAFNPANGELIWKFDCNPKDAFYKLGADCTRNDFVCTPVVYDNKLYIGVGQDPEHNKGVGHLWCIDITKEPKNKDKDLSPATKLGAKEGDSPQTIFDPKDPANKDSGLVWHYGGPAGEDAERNYIFGRTLSTCAIHDGLLYTSEYDGIVHCLDAKTGKKHWEFDMKADTWSSPYWVDGKIYIGNEAGKVFVFKHGPKMEKLAEINVKGKVRSTPVVSNRVMYMMTENPCKLYAIASK